MLGAGFAACFAGQARLNRNGMGVSRSDPHALRAVVGAALYLAVVGVTGLALGALLGNTDAAISTVVVVFFVLAPLTLLLPASWAEHFVPVPAGQRRREVVQRKLRDRQPAVTVDRVRGDDVVRSRALMGT